MRARPAGEVLHRLITTIDPLVATFAPVRVKGGRMVQPELSARIAYTRARPGVAEVWEAAPMQACVLTLEILDISGELLERHHIDLANALQDGPAWHLQYGGNSRNLPKPKTQCLTHRAGRCRPPTSRSCWR